MPGTLFRDPEREDFAKSGVSIFDLTGKYVALPQTVKDFKIGVNEIKSNNTDVHYEEFRSNGNPKARP